jgi:Ca2+-binding RTX toxin-like protein
MPHNPGRWTYFGTPGDDRVSGGAAYAARGRGGDDVLRGSAADDVLLGGRGRDRAVGSRGDDRCRAEDVRGCERS